MSDSSLFTNDVPAFPSGTDADKLRQRNRELSILNAIAEALNGEVDLARALHTALALVAELLDLQTGWIWLEREESGNFYLAAALSLPPALADFPTRMEGSCYCLDTYRAGDLEGAANINVVTCSRLKWLEGGTGGLRYHASIPLYAHSKTLGVLNVASPDWRQLSPSDLRLLHTIGDLLSIAIERARLFARSSQLGAAEERNRLAREIHDTIAQGLAAITLQLEAADLLLESGSNGERARVAIQRALGLARANMEEARRSVLDLRAAPLEGRTLSEALADLVAEQASKGPLTATVKMVGENHPLPVRIEVGLFRIAQEALNNVRQHAHATTVEVSLTMTPAEVTLSVEDDGHGFDVTQVAQGRFGLIGLNERARLLGGTLELCSSPGEGTFLSVTVPLA